MTKAESTTGQRIDEMTRRIVERFQPERIIRFGSHGCAEAEASSDLDILVVMPPGKAEAGAGDRSQPGRPGHRPSQGHPGPHYKGLRLPKGGHGNHRVPLAHEGGMLYAKLSTRYPLS